MKNKAKKKMKQMIHYCLIKIQRKKKKKNNKKVTLGQHKNHRFYKNNKLYLNQMLKFFSHKLQKIANLYLKKNVIRIFFSNIQK